MSHISVDVTDIQIKYVVGQHFTDTLTICDHFKGSKRLFCESPTTVWMDTLFYVKGCFFLSKQFPGKKWVLTTKSLVLLVCSYYSANPDRHDPKVCIYIYTFCGRDSFLPYIHTSTTYIYMWMNLYSLCYIIYCCRIKMKAETSFILSIIPVFYLRWLCA